MKAISHGRNIPTFNSVEKSPFKKRLREVVGATALTVTLAVGAASLVEKMESDASEVPQETTTHMIVPGETLWDIAGSLDPENERDPRDIVDEIIALNPELKAGSLDPGVEILLPRK